MGIDYDSDVNLYGVGKHLAAVLVGPCKCKEHSTLKRVMPPQSHSDKLTNIDIIVNI